MTNRIPDHQNPNQSVFNGEQSVDDYLSNRPPENNPYAHRDPAYRRDYADPRTNDYVYQDQRRRANNEAALSTILGIGVATLLALGVAALVWPNLFRGNDPQAPTVGPEQTESNIPTTAPTTEPRTSESAPDTVIIDRTRTQVVPVPVPTPAASPNPQPNSDVNITVPPTQPQTSPDVNVTVPPTQPQSLPDTDGTLLDTNPSPNPDTTTTPSVTNDGTNLQQSDPAAPVGTQPETNLNNTESGELVNPGDARTDR